MTDRLHISLCFVLLAILAFGACAERKPASAAAETEATEGAGRGGSTPDPSDEPAPPEVEALAVEGSHLASGWGSSGVVAADGAAPHWVVAIVEVRARSAVDGMMLADVTVVDARGESIARGDHELDLRVIGEDRSSHDLSTYGTESFDGRIEPGESVRLRVHARLPDGFAAPAQAQPETYRATLRLATGESIVVEGPLAGPWPTA